MINAELQKHPAPADIGNFLKGPWYTSAQLLLLKYGTDSEQWQKMSATTATLLDSFQNVDEVDESRRQQMFELVTRLPKEMRRWLLSLHHDTEAVNEAMGMVEFAHLRILRKQPLELLHITPIAIQGEHARDEDEPTSTGGHWLEGQWFSVENGKDGVVRVQLVLKVEQSRQLLFTNMAGIKVLQLSFGEFDRLISAGKVKTLNSGASFSLCLAHAVGIDSVEILDALVSALAQAEPEPQTQVDPTPRPLTEAAADPRPIATPEPGPTADTDVSSQPTWDEEITLEAVPGLDMASGVGLESELDAASGFDLDLDLDLEAEQEAEEDFDLAAMSAQLIAADMDPVGATTDLKDESPASDEAQDADPEVEQPSSEPPTLPPKPARGEGFLIDQAEEIKARGGYIGKRAALEAGENLDIEEIILEAPDYPPELDSQDGDTGELSGEDDASMEGLLAQTQRHTAGPEQPPETARDSEVDRTTAGNEDTPQDRREVNLPMGAWLGFHDGETPLMARLAVHDLENENYIFVNRQGVKMRQVSRLELLNLIDNGLVDILETRSNFRDAVTEVQKTRDQE